MVVVIQAPHAFAPGRLEPETLLEAPDQVKVAHEYARDNGLLVVGGEQAEEAEDEEEGEEGELVAGAVVEPCGRAERGEQVVRQLGRVRGERGWEEGGDEGGRKLYIDQDGVS